MIFIAFATSLVSFITMVGIGLAPAVLMDAFLIRGALVPDFMRLAGRANWWAPGPLRRFHARFGIADHVVLDLAAPSAGDPDRRRRPASDDDAQLPWRPQRHER